LFSCETEARSKEGNEQNIPEGADFGATAEEEHGQNGCHRKESKREKKQREKIRNDEERTIISGELLPELAVDG
jgi:hypothetical protein